MSPSRWARREEPERSATRWVRTRSPSWCPAIASSEPEEPWVATAAGSRASAGCWTSRRAERRLPAGRGLAPVEQSDEILGAGDSLPAPREEVLRGHPIVGERGHGDGPLIESSRDLDLVGAAVVAHHHTTGSRPASTVVASRGRHSHREHLHTIRPATAGSPQPLSPKWVPQSERLSWSPLSGSPSSPPRPEVGAGIGKDSSTQLGIAPSRRRIVSTTGSGGRGSLSPSSAAKSKALTTA